MKICFIRHGEAMDDVRNEYGGWHDPELAPEGIDSARKTAEIIKSKKIVVKKILTSPLRRAIETAKLVADELNLEVEVNVYLKERNTYGLLCGVNKDEAKEKYPELVEAYDNGEEVFGYEEYDFFVKRVKALVANLEKVGDDLICVTHGKMLTAIFKEIIGKPMKKINESCLVEVNLENGKMELIGFEGVELE